MNVFLERQIELFTELLQWFSGWLATSKSESNIYHHRWKGYFAPSFLELPIQLPLTYQEVECDFTKQNYYSAFSTFQVHFHGKHVYEEQQRETPLLQLKSSQLSSTLSQVHITGRCEKNQPPLGSWQLQNFSITILAL